MKVEAPAKRQHGLARSQRTALRVEYVIKIQTLDFLLLRGSHSKAMVGTMKSGTRAMLFYILAHTVSKWLITQKLWPEFSLF